MDIQQTNGVTSTSQALDVGSELKLVRLTECRKNDVVLQIVVEPKESMD